MCAKSRLIGTYQEPELKAGSRSVLWHGKDAVGEVLRTKDCVSPVFVSPGHRIDSESSVEILMKCVRGYRIPEPTRQAHLHVNELRRSAMSVGLKTNGRASKESAA